MIKVSESLKLIHTSHFQNLNEQHCEDDCNCCPNSEADGDPRECQKHYPETPRRLLGTKHGVLAIVLAP